MFGPRGQWVRVFSGRSASHPVDGSPPEGPRQPLPVNLLESKLAERYDMAIASGRGCNQLI